MGELRAAVEANPALKWEDGHKEVCGKVGIVMKDDESDGTTQVRFASLGVTAWLPTRCLTELEVAGKPGHKVSVAPLEQLKPAVEAVPSLQWNDRLEATCRQIGTVMEEDLTDNTTKLQFEQLMIT